MPAHLHIAALDNEIIPVPKLSLPAPYTYRLTEWGLSERGKPLDYYVERCRDAHIVLTSHISISAELVEALPELRAIFVMGSGYDYIEVAACRARGVHVANAPGCNSDGVAEHALATYFAARRRIPLMQNLLTSGELTSGRMKVMDLTHMLKSPSGEFPRLASSETMGIVGYGAAGKQLERLSRGLGMKVLIAARKGSDPVPEGRTAFETVVREATVLAICCPKNAETVNLISDAELDAMPNDALLVNVARGSIVDERALAEALKKGKIAGAAIDAFAVEPASAATSPLLGEGMDKVNLVLTPHIGWASNTFVGKFQECMQKNIASWLEGNPLNTAV